jgi:hypothetical protein
MGIADRTQMAGDEANRIQRPQQRNNVFLDFSNHIT